jgi:hypothetical protein
VPNATSTITVIPTASAATSVVRVNNVVTASGSASAPINLAVGANTINVAVTAQDGTTTSTYTLTVTRTALSANADLSNLVLSSGTLNPAFAPATISYTASVANTIGSITVTPTAADANSTVRVNGVLVGSGSASGAIALNVGVNNISVLVTAQDASTRTYSVAVTRAASANADLSALVLSAGALSPAFNPATSSYTVGVPNATTSTTVTATVADASATLAVNGTPLASGTASGAIALNVGANTVTVLVTAQDASTRTYTVTVNRASNQADLQVTISGNYGPATGLAQFAIVVSNAGPADVLGATVTNLLPTGITSYSFLCAGTGGGICSGTYPGTGPINRGVDLPSGASVTFSVVGTLATPLPETLTNVANVIAPANIVDPVGTNNSASMTLVNRIFGDSFDGGPTAFTAAIELKAGMPGAWDKVELPGDALAEMATTLLPIEVARFTRGDSTLLVMVRRFDGAAEVQLVSRTGKAPWSATEWTAVRADASIDLLWLGNVTGTAIEAARLQAAR